MSRFQPGLCSQLLFKSLAARGFGLLVFVWLTVYSPVHLLLEPHADGSFRTATTHGNSELCREEPEHSHGGHEQHLASDHQWRATAQQQASVEYGVVLFSTIAASEPPQLWFSSVFLTERVNPPGDTPPAPLLPRAPPVS